MSENGSDYDAGLLSDYGGGNVDWWWDYLRAEIGRANDHWRAQYEALAAEVAAREAAAAERAWKAGYFNACGCFIGDSEDDALIAAKQAWEINKREMCAPDALARVRAEAMREGMEQAAEIADAEAIDCKARGLREGWAAAATIRDAIRAAAQEIKP